MSQQLDLAREIGQAQEANVEKKKQKEKQRHNYFKQKQKQKQAKRRKEENIRKQIVKEEEARQTRKQAVVC